MFVELTREEAQLLSRLVHTRLSEMVRETDPSDYESMDIEQLRHKLERLEHRLHEAEWDVTC